MVQINFALKEVNCKIVYYGPGMSGKTTNLEIVHQKAPEENKGELTSISTDGDRTLFFDFMPLDLGTVAGMHTKFQLYTVPGQVYYNSTRKLVLQGCDGVIFVADSDPDKAEENIESYENLIENLRDYGKDIRELPHVIQYNKRDLPNAMPVEDLDRLMNKFGVPTFEAVATTGEGIFPTLKTLASMVLESVDRMDSRSKPAPKQAPAMAGAAAAPPPRSGGRRPAGPRQQQGGGAPAAGRQQAAPPAGRRRRAAAPAGQGQAQGQAQGQPQPTGRPGRRPMRAPAPAVAAAPKSGKGSGVGLAIAVMLMLAAAVAGVVFFVMQNKG